MTMTMSSKTMSIDPINPSHYRNSKDKQLIDVIRFLPFSVGNSVKYVFRHELKGKPREDLEKALWYLNDYKNNFLVDCPAPHATIFEDILNHLTDDVKMVCGRLLLLPSSPINRIEKESYEIQVLIERRLDLFS